MNALISQIAEAMGIEHTGIDFSLSTLRTLAPDARLLWLSGAVVAFCVVAVCQEIWFNHRQDR